MWIVVCGDGEFVVLVMGLGDVFELWLELFGVVYEVGDIVG